MRHPLFTRDIDKEKTIVKKKCLKVIVFFALLCGMLVGLSFVFHHRWTGNDDLYSLNMSYKEEPENSIDVLYFGTSEIYNSVFPTAMYEETGITGINFAVTHKSAITTYYQLEYALRYQKPKVVVCDFQSLFSSRLPSRTPEDETLYMKIYDTMPDTDIKLKLLASMKKEDPKVSVASYLFPVMRYHSMWNELTTEDFLPDEAGRTEYKEYMNGCDLKKTGKYEDERRPDITEIVPELWTGTGLKEDLSKVSMRWYDKFIDLCRENDITVVALFPPKVRDASIKMDRWAQITDYLNKRNVEIIDYNTYEQTSRLGLELKKDYCDSAHLNANGAMIFSRDLAHVLQEKYDLEDHRGQQGFEKWDGYWEEFLQDDRYDVE